MISTLVDTNILIDVLGAKSPMREWSIDALARCREAGRLFINPIIFAELAPSLSAEAVEASLAVMQIDRQALSFEAGWRAGLAHAAYRRAGGQRDRTLPDFLIGAHAETAKHALLTRDRARYAQYFPSIEIVSPGAA